MWDLVKSVVAEVLEQKPELIRGAVEDMLDNLGLVRAIELGRQTPEVDRAEMTKLLAG